MEKVDKKLVKEYIEQLYNVLGWFIINNSDFYERIDEILQNADVGDRQRLLLEFLDSHYDECENLQHNFFQHANVFDDFHQKLFGKTKFRVDSEEDEVLKEKEYIKRQLEKEQEEDTDEYFKRIVH